jgi:hypothetical protein
MSEFNHETDLRSSRTGVLFIDRINAANPLRYLEVIAAANSCAEQPAPNGTAAGVINLAQLVSAPFTDARLDVTQLRQLVRGGSACSTIRWMCRFALDAQRQQAQDQRRQVGVTGVANVQCWVCGMGHQRRCFARQLDANHPECGLWRLRPLAKERGAFPLYDADKHLASRGIQALDQDIRTLVERHGLRNGTLTTIAGDHINVCRKCVIGDRANIFDLVHAHDHHTTVKNQVSGSWIMRRGSLRRYTGPTPPHARFQTVADLSPDDPSPCKRAGGSTAAFPRP